MIKYAANQYVLKLNLVFQRHVNVLDKLSKTTVAWRFTGRNMYL